MDTNPLYVTLDGVLFIKSAQESDGQIAWILVHTPEYPSIYLTLFSSVYYKSSMCCTKHRKTYFFHLDSLNGPTWSSGISYLMISDFSKDAVLASVDETPNIIATG